MDFQRLSAFVVSYDDILMLQNYMKDHVLGDWDKEDVFAGITMMLSALVIGYAMIWMIKNALHVVQQLVSYAIFWLIMMFIYQKCTSIINSANEERAAAPVETSFSTAIYHGFLETIGAKG